MRSKNQNFLANIYISAAYICLITVSLEQVIHIYAASDIPVCDFLSICS